jgi:two-component system sensor histidine kinase DesK
MPGEGESRRGERARGPFLPAPLGRIGDGRPGLGGPFIAAALFFTLSPLVSLLANPPEPLAFVLLLIGWAIFAVVLLALFRVGPFVPVRDGPWLALAAAAMTAIAVGVQLQYGASEGTALYFYAGVTAARLLPERWAITGIAAVGLAAAIAVAWASRDLADGLTVGVTVATISLCLFALSALGRSNRELRSARQELAELAVAEERSRIARDLHDTLGHNLSLIALKSELARRVLPDDPERAAAEIADVERVAREALASVRETVSGYRRPTLAMELAGARAALAAAGIEGRVEPAPEGLPGDVDAVLGWTVREGVTNVLRHSGAATVRIRVLVDAGRRAVEVEDDGTGPAPGPTDEGSGLAGLRERAARLGGSVEAGPLPGRGFRLRVAIPVEPAPAATAGFPGA